MEFEHCSDRVCLLLMVWMLGACAPEQDTARSGAEWRGDARFVGLSPKDTETLDQKGILLSSGMVEDPVVFYQDRRLMPVRSLVTSDAMLAGYHALRGTTEDILTDMAADALTNLLRRLWDSLEGSRAQLDVDSALWRKAVDRSHILLGVAMKLLDAKVEFGESSLDNRIREEIEGIKGGSDRTIAFFGDSQRGIHPLLYSDLWTSDDSLWRESMGPSRWPEESERDALQKRQVETRVERRQAFRRAFSWLSLGTLSPGTDVDLLALAMMSYAWRHLGKDSRTSSDALESLVNAPWWQSAQSSHRNLAHAASRLWEPFGKEAGGGESMKRRRSLADLRQAVSAEPYSVLSPLLPGLREDLIDPALTSHSMASPNPGLEIEQWRTPDFTSAAKVLHSLTQSSSESRHPLGLSRYLSEAPCISDEIERLYRSVLVSLSGPSDPSSPGFMESRTWKMKMGNTILVSILRSARIGNDQSFTDTREDDSVILRAGFIEPVPEFYQRLHLLASESRKALADLCRIKKQEDPRSKDILAGWDMLSSLSEHLAFLCQKQLRGMEWDEDDEAWFSTFHLLYARLFVVPFDDRSARAVASSPVSEEIRKGDSPRRYACAGFLRPVYVLYPWRGRRLFCRGVASRFYEIRCRGDLNDKSLEELLKNGWPHGSGGR